MSNFHSFAHAGNYTFIFMSLDSFASSSSFSADRWVEVGGYVFVDSVPFMGIVASSYVAYDDIVVFVIDVYCIMI